MRYSLSEVQWVSLSHKVKELKKLEAKASLNQVGESEKQADVKQELHIVDNDVKGTGGDGSQRIAVGKPVCKMVSDPRFNDLVVDMYIEKGSTRKATLVFCHNIALMSDLTKRFTAKGINAASISSKIPESERQQVIDDFKAGKYAVLLNCQIMAEGTDVPMVRPICRVSGGRALMDQIDCIIVAKTVHSLNAWSQMISRLLRLYTEAYRSVEVCEYLHKPARPIV